MPETCLTGRLGVLGLDRSDWWMGLDVPDLSLSVARKRSGETLMAVISVTGTLVWTLKAFFFLSVPWDSCWDEDFLHGVIPLTGTQV